MIAQRRWSIAVHIRRLKIDWMWTAALATDRKTAEDSVRAYQSLKAECAHRRADDPPPTGCRVARRSKGIHRGQRNLGDPRDLGRVRDFLETFDDGFRLRRAFYLIDVLDGFTAQLSLKDRETFREVHRTLWAQFDRIRSLTWDAFEGESPAAKRVKGLRGQGGSALTTAVKEALKDVGVTLTSGLAGIRTSTLETCEKIESEISVLKERGLRHVTFPPHPFPRTFERYEIRDMFILPMQVLADLGEREQIGFIRISPAAATYIRKAPAAKLAGDTLGHFGGFLSRDWRANDVLWGRLDAAEVIVRVLLEGKPKTTVEEHIHRVQEEVTREELPLVWQDNPNLNYRAYLEERHKIGEQELAHLPAEHKVALAIRTSQVLRNMLRRLEQGELPGGLRAGFKYLGRILGSALSLIRWPATAVWGKDFAARKFATLLLFFLFGWGVLAFIAGLFGLFPLSGRLFTWILAFALPFLVWVLILEWQWGLLLTLGLALAAYFAWRSL